MTQWCQFCDKEMVLAGSVVHVRDYITCGSAKCAKKAKKMSIEIYKDMNKSTGPVDLLVFATQTPDVLDSWYLIQNKKDRPAFMSDPAVIDAMLMEGVIAEDSDAPGTYYMIRKREEIEAMLQEDFEANPEYVAELKKKKGEMTGP